MLSVSLFILNVLLNYPYFTCIPDPISSSELTLSNISSAAFFLNFEDYKFYPLVYPASA